MECDLKCPTIGNKRPVFCCCGCNKSRKYFIDQNPELKKFWNDSTGFLTETGCSLLREQRPKECNEYNCKDYLFSIARIWKDGNWIDTIVFTNKR